MTLPVYNRLMRTIILLAVIFLSGCSAMKFHKDGASNRELSGDWTYCEAMNPYSGVIPWRRYMENCMNGKGWDRES